MHTPRVFCVVPVHNRLTCLRTCLADLERQEFPGIHVVVVDDGSTDGTAEWLATQRHVAVTVLRGDGSLWWGGAMRLGMEHVLGIAQPEDYLLMLNDDVRIAPDFVSALVEESCGAGGAVVGALQMASGTDEVLDYGCRVDYLRTVVDTITREDGRPPDALAGRGALYPVSLVQRIGVIRATIFPHYFGDLEYSARAVAHGATLHVSPRAIVRTDPVSSDQVIRSRGVWATAFSARSKSNLFHRAAFFTLSGPWWLRPWAAPRLLVMTVVRGLGRA